MGSDVSVVLHADAAVPAVVGASQRRVQGTAATHNKGISNDKNKPSSAVERCPVIRVIEANAARRLAGDSSAASMASNADPHPLEQPILLIRSCNELDAFTKSRTYVPVLRALYAYLDRHESNTKPAATPSFSNPVSANRNSEGAARRPVCPIGLVFDRSLSLGTRLASADARAACAQYLKLFWVHLIAALEFVREPDDVAHTRWPSSPAVLASREASTGATAASQPPPPRLSVLYLDLRSNDVEDDSAKWFAASVILRAVRRARPFMLVSARGEAAAGATAATAAGGGTGSSGGGSNAFMNFYSPDVKADMVWASLQHVLLTDNPHLTSGGATALLEELLATDATRDVLLRQQGFDPKAQRAQAVTEALNSGHVRPRPDAQLLPQLVLVDLDHNHPHDAANSPAKPESSSVPPDPLERSSAAVSTVPSSSVVAAHTAERGMMLAAAAAGGSLPPSPQSNIPEPTARGKATPPVPTQAAELSAAVDNATPGGQQEAPTPLQEPQDAAAQLPAQQQQQQQQQPLQRRVPPQHTQHIKRAVQKPSLKAAVVAETPSKASAAKAAPAAPQEPQAPPPPPPLLSPPHPPPQQRVVKAPQPDPLVSDPAPSHSPKPEFTSPPLSSTPRATMNGNAVDGPALPQLQRPTTPPVTPPRAAANAETATAASTPAPSPQPREPEPTHSPAELPVAAASASSPPPPPPPPAAVRKAQIPKKKKPQQQQQQQQQQQRQAHVDVAVAPATAKPKSARGGSTAVPASATAPSKQQPKKKPLSPAPSPADAAATAAPNDNGGVAPPAPSAPTPAAAAAAGLVAAPPSARRSSGSSLHSFVKLPGEESATKQHKPQAATPPVAHAARNNAAIVKGGKEDKTLPAPSQPQGHEAPLISPRPQRATSARKPRSPAGSAATTEQQQHQQQDGGACKTRSARPQTTTTPPQLSRTSRRGLNGKAVPLQIPLLPLPSRDASPRQRARQAIATAAALDDAPDAVVRGHSARRPRETSPRPHVRCHSPTPPISARWVAAAEDRLPSPAHPAYFHSPVRPDALELDTAHALLAELRSPESEKMRAASHRRPSAPPPLISPRGRRPAAARRTSSEEATIEVPDHVEQQPPREHRDNAPEATAAGEEPWLDHAHPIERSSHVESLPAPPLSRRSGNGYRPYTNYDGGNTPRSGRRRGFDIAALDPPEPQFAAAAAKITPTVWEAGVRKRHASPAQVGAARRATTPPGSARSRGRGISGGAYDAVQPRTNSPRQRDNVAAAKAAYEAATLAEVRAKEAQARRTQQRRSSAAFRLLQQQHQLEMEKGASLKVEGEVQSEHDDARRSEEDDANASQSPAPNRPNGGRTPPSPQTPFSKDAEQRQQRQRGGQAGVSAAPRSLYARRRLSTAEPPHLDPGHTTTSKLRQLTSQRTRRVSEAEAEIKTFYANRATPRRDFRGAAALASMALPQPTRDELTFVQQLQQQANERRHSLSARSGGVAMDQRRGSGAAARVREPEVTDSLDVSNPAWRPSQQRGSARGTPATTRYSSTAPPAKQQWTPAYQHRHGLRSPRNVQNAAASDIDEDDESEAPSLSPWGTADYQGSAPRVDERDGMSPGEVNENGVELVHKALRTQRRAYY